VTTYDDDRDKESYANGDDGSCSPLEQLQKIQDTVDELEGQLVVLHDLLAPTEAAPSPLAEFLKKLETNTGLKAQWIQNPDAVIDASGLAPADKAALKTGGIDAVNQQLAAEGASNFVPWVRIWVRP
jgi:hypothetical protein